MSNRTPPANRFVYVIGPPVGLQKVGLATDPKQRLATLQTACPFDLFLHLAVAVPFAEARAIERTAHRLLARSCVRNEWFETTAKEAIAAVRKAVAGRPARSAQAAPVEWLGRQGKRAPAVGPLLAAGRQIRPEAAFHKASSPAPLPLFEFAHQAARDEQALVDRVAEALLKRMGG